MLQDEIDNLETKLETADDKLAELLEELSELYEIQESIQKKMEREVSGPCNANCRFGSTCQKIPGTTVVWLAVQMPVARYNFVVGASGFVDY